MNLLGRQKKAGFRVFIVMMAVLSVGFGILDIVVPDVTPKTLAAGSPAGYIVPQNFAEVAEMVSPAVVNISTEKTVRTPGGPNFRHFQSPFGEEDPFHDFFERFFGNRPPREFKERSLGSGFIIDKEGYIVTNNHVVENADEIKVKLSNGREYEATIVGRDPKTDIALLKAEGMEEIGVVKIGDSDEIKVGQWVVAIGSPFGLEHTVTAGIVSAKGRVIGSGPYDDFIQTDASINPGNSGGPLVNMSGEVVGINTAIVSRGGGNVGIGFAIPINMARGIISQLQTTGSVTRGWLGVTIQDLTPELADYYGLEGVKGAIVGDVFEGDPADKAGIQPKDVIVEVEGKTIENSRDLSRVIAATQVGEKVTVTVLRNGKERTFRIKIAKRTDDKETLAKKDVEEGGALGMVVSPLTPELARRFDISEGDGIVVVGVDAQSEADKAGIREGDLILEINHKLVRNIEDYQQYIEEVAEGETVSLLIRRRAGFFAVNIRK